MKVYSGFSCMAWGVYKRFVEIFKRYFRKAIGKGIPTWNQILTLLLKMEAVINTRPLTSGYDVGSNFALTLAHFLNGSQNLLDSDSSAEDYKEIYDSANKLLTYRKQDQRILEVFWKTWYDEYLLSLRERFVKGHKGPRLQTTTEPRIGEVVVISDQCHLPTSDYFWVNQIIITFREKGMYLH